MKNLTAGIDSDGISENHDVETYYHQCSGAMVDEENEFFELTFENGGIDGVTRIGLDELKELGFTLITPPSDCPGESKDVAAALAEALENVSGLFDSPAMALHFKGDALYPDVIKGLRAALELRRKAGE